MRKGFERFPIPRSRCWSGCAGQFLRDYESRGPAFGTNLPKVEGEVLCCDGGLPFVPAQVEAGGFPEKDCAFYFYREALRRSARKPGEDVVSGGVGLQRLPKGLRGDARPLVSEAQSFAEAADCQQSLLCFDTGANGKAVPPADKDLVGAFQQACILKALPYFGGKHDGRFSPTTAKESRPRGLGLKDEGLELAAKL